MIQVSHLSKAYGGQVVLSDLDFSLFPGQRVGLVGRNGTGKTTLLRLMCGLEEPDRGSIALAPGARVGYLGQEGQLSPDRTLYDEMQQLFAHIDELEAELRALENEMGRAQGGELQSCLNRYAQLQVEFEHAEGHLVDARIRTVLAGLGFRPEDLERRCREFSGGWQMRGAMARLLLSEPNLLLLDEPTNHLDVQAVEWLEQFLSTYKGAVVLVSHDRWFLDRAVNRVVELRDASLDSYAGNYSYYLEEKERRREAQQSAFDTQQRKLEHDQRFIDRFRYKATLATRVKSREKMLDRMEKVEAPEDDISPIRVSFTPASTSGRDTLVARGLYKAYGPIQVLEDVGFKAEREDRIALLGANGAGKSTLLRILAGMEHPDRGNVTHGYRLSPVYFAQHQAEALDPALTVLEEVEQVASADLDQTRIRTLLGCLLFSGDTVYKKVGVLSGGERSRVALARCIVRPSNVLFLDEPTNHLDISARESLLQALENYPGTIIFISHDRHFMDGLATRVLEIRERKATGYLGNWSDFKARREAEIEREARAQAAATRNRGDGKKAARPGGRVATPPAVRTAAPAAPRTTSAEDGRAPGPPQKRKPPPPWKIKALEQQIFDMEEEMSSILLKLETPEVYTDPVAPIRLQARYDQLSTECRLRTAEWEELASLVEDALAP